MIQDHQLQELCTQREPMLVLGSLPDTFQWKRVLMISCKDTDTARSILKLTLPTGAVFTGPAGNGRHTTAEALAGSLYNKGRNYAQVLCLHGEDLDFAHIVESYISSAEDFDEERDLYAPDADGNYLS